MRPLVTVALVAAFALSLTTSAHAGTIAVVGNELRIELSTTPSGPRIGAGVFPIDAGAVRVVFYGVPQSGHTIGGGCGPADVASAPRPVGLGGGQSHNPNFAAACSLTGVTRVRGNLQLGQLEGSGGHLWHSPEIALPTTVSVATSGPQTGISIATGDAADTITGGAAGDFIDAGLVLPVQPPPGVKPDPQVIEGAGGDDTIFLSRGAHPDTVRGGAGVDTVSYATRFPVGAPGQQGVRVTLDGTANDGDAAAVIPGSSTPGERDNVGGDVENVIGTAREDRLTGDADPNRLEGLAGVDSLTGGDGADLLVAREPAGTSGIRDTLNCGLPASPTPPIGIQPLSGAAFALPPPPLDRVNLDLADVRPSNCELVEEGPVREGPNVRWAAKAARTRTGFRLAFTCPPDAGRTCAGSVKAAGTRDLGPAARFSIKRGRRATVAVPLSATTLSRIAGRAARLRLVAVEKGRFGAVTTIGFTDVPRR